MKTYNNGPRKGMMYGGAAKRKPMMYGGTAKTPRKKNQARGMMGMAKGDIAINKKKSDLNKDGRIDEYEMARGKAIQKAMSTRTA